MIEHVEYHEQRAARELSLGLTAQSMAAARAHLQLSSMHRERMRALGGDSPRVEAVAGDAMTSSDPNAQYHIDRARAELDLAYRASPRAAAEAHMRLSALHMERARSSPSVVTAFEQQSAGK